jgi:catechol 2,3-dioxygenase-like lactoylglutathione lyase family enzyme
MKRFHVHVGVADLAQSIRFYSALFASEPSVVKSDYAKWMLDDPRINFAISQRGSGAGVNHLGLQVDDAEELEQVHERLKGAEGAIVAEKDIACCYARSDKYWITDPQGVAWETFRSLATVPFYSPDDAPGAEAATDTCCAPVTAVAAPASTKSCCAPAKASSAASNCC